jgi:hypothetical protein
MKKFIPLLLVLALVGLVGSSCLALAPVVVSFDASPTVITAGGSATLTWNVSGANSVTIDQGLGTLPPAGSQVISPRVTTVYTLQANNGAGTVSRSAVVTVNQVPIVIDLGVNPAVITSGASAALVWDVSGATSVTIDQGVGNVPVNGSQLVSPSTTTPYTLTASGPGGTASKSVVLAVNPPINATFSIYPNVISVSQFATLQWNVTGADSVTIDQGVGSVPPVGQKVVYPYYTTVYTLTATSSCCAVTKSAVLTVGSYYPYGMPMYPGFPYGYPYMYPFRNLNRFPTVDIINVTPNAIHAGQSATLHWYVTGAASVFISGIGNVQPSGSRTVTPTHTTTYTLTSANSYGTTTRNVTLTVQ